MKKILVVAIAAIMMFALVGCGGGSDATVAGSWTHVDTLVGEDSYYDLMGGESMLDFTFNEDGTGTTFAFGDDSLSVDLQWTQEGDVVSIDNGTDVLELTFDGGQLLLVDEATDTVMVFEKQ